MGTSDTAFAQLVEVAEELFNADAFHHHGRLQAFLDVSRVAQNVHFWVQKSVIDHVHRLCVLFKEGTDLFGSHANLFEPSCLRFLRLIGWEHILGTIHILAEQEVVDFLCVAAVTVIANDEVKHFVAGRHNVEGLQDSEELLRRDVQLLRPVEVHETGLEQNAVRHDVLVQGRHHLNHLVFLLICEDLFEFLSST